eukprot:gene1997-1453_t
MGDYSTEGCHYGEVAIQNGILSFASKVSGKGIFEMKLDNVEQCVVPQNNRSDLEIQFAESKEKNRDSVVKMVFHFPRKRKEPKEPKEKDNEDDEEEEEESEEEEETMAEAFRQQVMDNGIISSAAGEVLVEFTKDQGNFVSPRGKYALKFTPTTMQMLGTPYTFNISYENLDSSFILQKGQTSRYAFVICLKSPIRVGNQKYQNLVLETNDDRETTIEFNVSQEELSSKYTGLEQQMTNTLSNLMGKVFKGITVKANDGLLYPMAKSFIFIHKPTLIIKFDDIASVEFERYTPNANAATKNFDLKLILKESAVKAGEAKEFMFSSIDRAEYRNLVEYMESKSLNAKAKKEKEVKAKKEKAPTKAAAKKRTRDEDEDGGKKKRQKKEKKEKDPNAPKGATTSFMLFSNAVRGQVKGENPGVSVTELSKLIGAKWREMTAEEKEPYEERARQDKQR